tara:strand:+ start:145 stop:276 length:132 start_codon:yes stop_codon:yes gene_type:complete
MLKIVAILKDLLRDKIATVPIKINLTVIYGRFYGFSYVYIDHK